MGWQEDAAWLYEASTLGKRQAQIAVLTAAGKQPAKIVDLLEENEGEAPAESTIQSIMSKLNRELLKANTTRNQLLGGVESVRPPAKLPNEMTGSESTEHIYLGDIGSGMTVTAQSHAWRLHQNSGVSDFLVFDPLGEWEKLTGTIGGVEQVVPDGESDVEKFLDEIKARPTDQHTAVFIDQAHIVLRQEPELISRVREWSNNISLRLITYMGSDYPEGVEPSAYHFHRSKQSSVQAKLGELGNQSAIQTGIDPSLLERFPEPLEQGPAHVISAIPETGEQVLRTNILSADERDLLLK